MTDLFGADGAAHFDEFWQFYPRKVGKGRKSIPAHILKVLLSYDAGSGSLTWRARTPLMFAAKGTIAERQCAGWNKRFAGKETFKSNDGAGYGNATVLNTTLRAHRVAWAIHYGRWPDGQIDHIDGDRGNNRICNLRDVSSKENSRNTKVSVSNKSGHVGVIWHKASRKWQSAICVDGRNIHIGYFDDKELAISARKEAQRKYGFHKNHGVRNGSI